MIINLQLVRFLPNDSFRHTNFVDIEPKKQCSSPVGNLFKAGDTNGRQTLWLRFKDTTGSQVCGFARKPAYGVIIHELCHTLGGFSVHHLVLFSRKK